MKGALKYRRRLLSIVPRHVNVRRELSALAIMVAANGPHHVGRHHASFPSTTVATCSLIDLLEGRFCDSPVASAAAHPQLVSLRVARPLVAGRPCGGGSLPMAIGGAGATGSSRRVPAGASQRVQDGWGRP